jgi:hypothetical protein
MITGSLSVIVGSKQSGLRLRFSGCEGRKYPDNGQGSAGNLGELGFAWIH